MQCQYTHLAVGTKISIKLSDMRCNRCGKKVPRQTVVAAYQGHQEILEAEFKKNVSDDEVIAKTVVAADWFTTEPESKVQCECGLRVQNMFILCKGDWYKSFFETVSKSSEAATPTSTSGSASTTTA